MTQATSRYATRTDTVIPSRIESHWQRLVDLMGKLFDVPASMIIRAHEREMEVFASAERPDAPYRKSEMEQLGSGLFSEEVLNTGEILLVPNALRERAWRRNPAVKREMISYLGMPLYWPTGEVFGTICVLDNKPNLHSPELISLMTEFSRLVMSDLASLEPSTPALRAGCLYDPPATRARNDLPTGISFDRPRHGALFQKTILTV